jgi:hypothetical protein
MKVSKNIVDNEDKRVIIIVQYSFFDNKLILIDFIKSKL